MLEKIPREERGKEVQKECDANNGRLPEAMQASVQGSDQVATDT